MLDIQNLTKKYGKFLAVDNLNLHIDKGEIFGFVGPNGAGKTTTMKIVCGLLQASGGNVTVDGVDALNHADDIKRKVGYVPDFFGVYDNLKVMEYMEFFGYMYGMEKEDVDEIAEGLLELVNLYDKKEVFVDTLSRGMKQRLCVARALIHNPDLLVLDEPNSGLDPRARFEMKEVLKNLGSMGKTIIISSHILPELSEMCTSIGIMEKGHLVTSGRVDDVMNRYGGTTRIHIRVAGLYETGLREAVPEGEMGMKTTDGGGADAVPLGDEEKKAEDISSGEDVDAVSDSEKETEDRGKVNAVPASDEEKKAGDISSGEDVDAVSDSEKETGDRGKVNAVPADYAWNEDMNMQKEKLLRILKEQPNVTKVSLTEDEVLVSFNGDERESAVLLKNLIGQGIDVCGFYKEKEDLESLFLEITGNGAAVSDDNGGAGREGKA